MTPACVTSIVILVWLIAGLAIALQSSFDLGPDFCARRFSRLAIEQVIGACILVGLPNVMTVFVYLLLISRVQRACRTYKPPVAFSWDYELIKTNMFSFIMFVIFWMPFGVAICVSSVQQVSANVFINLAWLALSKSCFNSMLYCVFDRHFRNAYVKLFHYCCCKTTVSFSRRPRGEPMRPSTDVRLRVHIIHSYASPSSGRPAVTRQNGRDVYEL